MSSYNGYGPSKSSGWKNSYKKKPFHAYKKYDRDDNNKKNTSFSRSNRHYYANDSSGRESRDDDEFYNSMIDLKYDPTNQQPFEKVFYKENEETSSQTYDNVKKWKLEHKIECFSGYNDNLNKKKNNKKNLSFKFDDGDNNSESSKPITYPDLPKPVQEFKNVGFPNYIMSGIKKSGFTKPTAIQSVTWPMIMLGNNVIGIAQTGSGKTLAFLLPSLVHIKAQKYSHSPIALVIAPTRELVQQIEGELEIFSKSSNIKYCAVYGGSPKYKQKQQLKYGCQIIIATPGRLLDFIQSNVISCQRITYVVMDEADRLLDMGFEPQLNKILNQIRPDRQICMFSATWPLKVRLLAKKYMITKEFGDKNIMQVTVGGCMDKLQANLNVKQIIKVINHNEKIDLLKEEINKQLEKNEFSKILVFISTKKMTNIMSDILWEDGYYVTCIHGDKEQKQRERALNKFRNGEMSIMLATDVASRGIHVNDINLVINFDMPQQIEDYIHRIGRTGRAGKKGESITFFVDETDGFRAKDLIKILKISKQDIPKELMDLQYSNNGGSKKKRNRNRGRYGNSNRGRKRW